MSRVLGPLTRRLVVLVGLCLAAVLPVAGAIHYRVSLADPSQHVFGVTMTIPDVRHGVEVQMPAWNALYQIRDFASRVMEVRAQDAAGRRLEVRKRDPLTWQVSGSGTVVVEYGVFWDEPGPFASQLDSDHAFLNLAMVLFYVPDRRAETSAVEFTGHPADWGIAVALPASTQPNSFQAKDYDALVDAPVEIGRFDQFYFEVEGARIRVAVHGGNWNRGSLEEKLRRIVAYQVQMMKGAPFDEYLFIYHFGSGGGGMEHANSTAISAGSDANVEGVSAHEFFHLWNVKRIRPASLEPVDYTRENHTRALWFAEGVTSAYADYTLVRTGLWTPQRFYASLAREISQLQSRPASRWKSAEEASLDAWFEKYRLYRRGDFSISYYNKGQILGHLLDILIRDATDNRKSLDDVFRYLNEEARAGRYYADSEGIRAAVERVAGRSFAEFFERYVAGTDPLPYEDVLARAGLEFRMDGDRASIRESAGASDRQRHIREGLLQGTTN